MRRTLAQVVRFGAIGVLGTGAYLLLFVALRHLGPQPDNVVSRAVVALPTSWLNARLTFRSRVPVHRAYAAGLWGLALGAAIGAAVLLAVEDLDPGASGPTVLLALGAAQVAAAAVRFGLLRRVARPGDTQHLLTSP